MARSVILGNGSLTVGLNERGLVNDFYYPYVGLDNLNTSRSMHHRIGVWVDNTFSWTDDDAWDIQVDFETEALITNITMRSDNLQIELGLQDFVDWDINAFCRKIHVKNLADRKRNVRIFMHQVYEISRAGRADTALYVPEANYILDYKGRCSLLIYGQHQDGTSFDQYSVGNYGIEGKEGTYKDAEDGELSGNAVEHGGVDSVIRLNCSIEAGSAEQLQYWTIAADSQYSAEKVHHQLKQAGLDARLEESRKSWHNWMAPALQQADKLPPEYQSALTKSLLVIKAHTDKRGGIIASCDSSIYNYGRDYYSYVWPRDGAYVMWPLIKLGMYDEPKRFFEFCRDILTSDGYLMHKYQPDRAIGSTWHPLVHGKHSELAIQEDETAIVVFMLREYVKHSGDLQFADSLYATFIQPAANFLARYIDKHTSLPHASYDLWEEKFLTSTYSTAITLEALLAAAEFADSFEYPDDAVHWRDAAKTIRSGANVFYDVDKERLRKGYLLQDNGSLQFDNVLDVSSLYGAWKYNLYKQGDEFLVATERAIDGTLTDVAPVGGTPRYESDNYFACDPQYMGNPWFVTSLWMAQYKAANGNKEAAMQTIDWTLAHALPSGVLSEQVDPSTGQAVSVTPLVWSHAELINTILDVVDK